MLAVRNPTVRGAGSRTGAKMFLKNFAIALATLTVALSNDNEI